ncbi:hypothetical protein BH10BDE1_BH10BDE1_30430 [soil metagenome]
MKCLVLLAGAALVMSSAAQAQDSEVKHNGEFRVRYYNDMTPSGVKDQPANKSDVATRLKLGLTMRKGENLQAHVTLLHQTVLGADKNVATLTEPNGYSTVNNNNGILVNQAYGWWKAGEGFTMKAGRFNVDIGGGEFFSADQWKQVPTTHEGFQVGYDTGFAMFNGYLIQDKELTAAPPLDSDPEQHNVILSGDLKNMPEAIKTANITLVNIARSETAAVGSANMQHVGLTVGGDVAGFTYKALYAMQMGVASKLVNAETNAKGSMFDVTVGYGLPETMGLKLWANYHSDSGDDNAADGDNNEYAPLYYDSHKFSGNMDMFAWGNLSYWSVGAAVVPAEDLEAGLKLFGFSKTKENGAVNTAANPNHRQNFAGLKNSSDLGMELDVYATKKYGPAFSIDANLGAFMPGAAFKDAAVKKEATIMQLMIAGTMTF